MTRSKSALKTLAPASGLSTSPTGFHSSAIGSRFTPTPKCMTTFRRSTLPAALPSGLAYIFPMCPALPKLDMRVEAVSTDPSISNSQGGHFMYYEASRDRVIRTRANCSATG